MGGCCTESMALTQVAQVEVIRLLGHGFILEMELETLSWQHLNARLE